MTKRKTTQKKQGVDGQVPFIVGTIMLLLTFVPQWIFGAIGGLLCEKTEYGGCEMGSGLLFAAIANGLTVAWIVVSLVILIYGAGKVLFISRL